MEEKLPIEVCDIVDHAYTFLNDALQDLFKAEVALERAVLLTDNQRFRRLLGNRVEAVKSRRKELIQSMRQLKLLEVSNYPVEVRAEDEKTLKELLDDELYADLMIKEFIGG
jgi:uncharacterized protein YqiB (DUF1249 family)